MIAGLAVLFGLITGSFLNVVIYRLPAGKSVIYPRSRCLNCGHMLKTGDLVPVLSYVWLKGRCRYCGEKISIQYPVIELLTAAGFWLIYLKWNISFFTLSGWLLTSVLIVCAAVDWNMGIIPNLVTYPGMMLGLFLSCFTVGVPSAFLGALLLGGILLLTAFLSRGGNGWRGYQTGFPYRSIYGAAGGIPGICCFLPVRGSMGCLLTFQPQG